MVVHIADLLGCGHSDWEWCVDFEKVCQTLNDWLLLDSGQLGLQVEAIG